jgi:nitrite reductase/ring-hydroxylating ferredoxin subunit
LAPTPERPGAARWHRVTFAGDRAVVDLDGKEILVLRTERGVYAFDARCPHEGNPLSEGEILGDTLVCAFHGWRFDLETGSCVLGEEPVHRYPVEVRGEEVRIDLGPA